LLIPYELAATDKFSRGPFLSLGYHKFMTIQEDPGEQTFLEGMISVQAALQSGNRSIFSLLVRADKASDGAMRRLLATAKAQGVTVETLPCEEIDARASGKSHGGILALVGPRRFVSLDTLLAPKTTPFVVMIDGVEDPFNFGQAVRSLYAAGAGGLVVRPRNWMSAAGVVARASAGASELIPTAITETAEDAAAFFQEHGLRIACATDAPPTTGLYDADLTQPLFLLIGGEKRGVTRSFEAKADLRLRIPYARAAAHSLGTAAAAAVLGFEVMRQRLAQKDGPT
jgi:23S rRNA (guanosine2251-2'-O)-methyltransferase